jgi:uncharacterized protein YndB with AHSA1/START domain
MLKKVLIVLAAAIVGLLIFTATRPAAYHVERSITIKAPADAVFAAAADLKTFTEWSPWEKRDPAMKKTFSPNTSGVGASYGWQGNKQVGSGKMTVTEHNPPGKIRHKLEFIEPFTNVAESGFDITSAGAGETKVTWVMDGNNNFVGKAFSLVMDMDKAIGKDFEEGLANLKRLVEAKAAAAPAAAAAAAPPAEAAAAAEAANKP